LLKNVIEADNARRKLATNQLGRKRREDMERPEWPIWTALLAWAERQG